MGEFLYIFFLFFNLKSRDLEISNQCIQSPAEWELKLEEKLALNAIHKLQQYPRGGHDVDYAMLTPAQNELGQVFAHGGPGTTDKPEFVVILQMA